MTLLAQIQELTTKHSSTKLTIAGFGEIGIKKLTLQERDDWIKEKENSSAYIMQTCLLEPETLEPALKDMSLEEIKKIPAQQADALVKEIYRFNGLLKEDPTSTESEQLKN